MESAAEIMMRVDDSAGLGIVVEVALTVLLIIRTGWRTGSISGVGASKPATAAEGWPAPASGEAQYKIRLPTTLATQALATEMGPPFGEASKTAR